MDKIEIVVTFVDGTSETTTRRVFSRLAADLAYLRQTAEWHLSSFDVHNPVGVEVKSGNVSVFAP